MIHTDATYSVLSTPTRKRPQDAGGSDIALHPKHRVYDFNVHVYGWRSVGQGLELSNLC